MKKENEEFEDMFKDEFEKFEPEVDSKIWKNVKSVLKWGGIGLFFKMIVNKIGTGTLIAVVSSVVTLVSTMFVMEQKTQKVESDSSEKVEVVKETIIVKGDLIKEEATEIVVVRPVVVKPFEKSKEKIILKPTISKEGQKRIDELLKKKNVKSTAIISTSTSQGPAPLVIDMHNIGYVKGVESTWVFSDGQAPLIGKNPPPCVFVTPGVHTITLYSKDANGKEDIDKIKITVTGNSTISRAQSVITPNGDGVADVFYFKTSNLKSMNIMIFDEGRNLIYKWEGTDGKWDGTDLQGKDCTAGNYLYILNAEGVDGKIHNPSGIIKLER